MQTREEASPENYLCPQPALDWDGSRSAGVWRQENSVAWTESMAWPCVRGWLGLDGKEGVTAVVVVEMASQCKHALGINKAFRKQRVSGPQLEG